MSGLQIKIMAGQDAPQPQPVPSGIPMPAGTFCQIKHDYEALDGLVRVGMPSVLSMYLNNYTDLTEAWQWFWFRQMVHAYTGYAHWDEKRLTSTQLSTLKSKWRSLTKSTEAFTNFKGTNRYKDYVSPNDLTGTPGQEPLVCTGNIVRIMGGEISLGGVKWLPIETLDGTRPPPPIEQVNRLTRPDLIASATNVAADKSGGYGEWKVIMLPDGTWRVDPFPQLAPRHTPFALRTNGRKADDLKARLREKGISAAAGAYARDGVRYAINYVKLRRLKEYHGQVVPNPFNPPQ